MIEGTLALLLAFICFAVPMAIPLFAQRWRTLGIIVLAGVAFFAWMTVDMPKEGSLAAGIGAFLGGLMLFGFVAGTIARFVQLLGPSRAPQKPAAPKSEGDEAQLSD